MCVCGFQSYTDTYCKNLALQLLHATFPYLTTANHDSTHSATVDDFFTSLCRIVDTTSSSSSSPTSLSDQTTAALSSSSRKHSGHVRHKQRAGDMTSQGAFSRQHDEQQNVTKCQNAANVSTDGAVRDKRSLGSGDSTTVNGTTSESVSNPDWGTDVDSVCFRKESRNSQKPCDDNIVNKPDMLPNSEPSSTAAQAVKPKVKKNNNGNKSSSNVVSGGGVTSRSEHLEKLLAPEDDGVDWRRLLFNVAKQVIIDGECVRDAFAL